MEEGTINIASQDTGEEGGFKMGLSYELNFYM